MNLAQLHRDYEKAFKETESLMARVTKACAAEGDRMQTDAERAELKAKGEELEALKGKIDLYSSDERMKAKLLEMMGNRAPVARETSTALTRVEHRSLGRQFVEAAEYEFFTKGLHRAGSTWRSPIIELVDGRHAELLTTSDDSPGSGGALISADIKPGIRPLLFRRLVMADLIAPGTTSSNVIIYMEESYWSNAADVVAEGAEKPESALRFTQQTEQVVKLAHWIPVTEEMLEDAPQIRSYIDSRLTLGVQQTEDDAILNGSSSPGQITGLLMRSGLGTTVTVGAGTKLDALARQINALFSGSFVPPDGIVVHPNDWSELQLQKSTTGEYLGTGPFDGMQAPRVWGLPVVVTPQIPEGTALVGAFGSEAQIFRKGGIRVEASNSHSDFFIKNKVAIRAEERFALAVYRPAAFGKVTGL